MGDEKALRIEYVRLDEAIKLLWKRNPKRHALDSLAASFKQHGFRDAPAFDANLQDGGAIVDGNGRVETLGWMYDQKQEPPVGILLDKDDGMWCVPIQFGIDAPSQEAAESYALDANNLTMAGGDFTAWDYSRMWDEGAYVALLEGLAEADMMPVSVDGEDLSDLLAVVKDFDAYTEWEGMPEFEQEDVAYQAIRVHFENAAGVSEFAELVKQTITSKTKSIRFPYKKAADLKSLGYVDES